MLSAAASPLALTISTVKRPALATTGLLGSLLARAQSRNEPPFLDEILGAGGSAISRVAMERRLLCSDPETDTDPSLLALLSSSSLSSEGGGSGGAGTSERGATRTAAMRSRHRRMSLGELARWSVPPAPSCPRPKQQRRQRAPSLPSLFPPTWFGRGAA